MSTNAARILQLAARLCREVGVAGVTTHALARELGVSKRTLYEHFPSRDAILEAVVMARLDRLEAELRAVEAVPGSVAERIRSHAAIVAVVPGDFALGFWPQLERAAPAVAARVVARRQALSRSALERVFSAGVAAGELRADVPLPLMIAVTETLQENLLRREPPPGHTRWDLAQAAFAILLQGLRAQAAP